MADQPTTVRSALEDALSSLTSSEEEEATTTEDTAAAEVTDEGGTTPEAPGAEDETTQDETPAEGETETPAPAGDEGTDEPPTEYFGQDLSGLPAEERAALIAQFQERDRHIQKLLREKAEAAKEGEKPTGSGDAEPSEDEVTDSAILEALALDPSDDSPGAKALVAMARMNLELQAEVKAMASKDEVRETERVWETALTALEKEYGSLPVDRIEVYKTAVDNGIADPESAYWRIMGPARQEVMAEVKKRREAATAALAERKAPLKPKASPKTEPEGPESKEVKAATREVMQKLFSERGGFPDDFE